MLEVRERLNRINKLRRLLGMKYSRSVELQINSLMLANLAELKAVINAPGFDVLRDVLEKTAQSSDQFIITNALSGDTEILAYHKALGAICRKCLEVFDSSKLDTARREMEERNSKLNQEEVLTRPKKKGPDFLDIVRSLEDAR